VTDQKDADDDNVDDGDYDVLPTSALRPTLRLEVQQPTSGSMQPGEDDDDGFYDYLTTDQSPLAPQSATPTDKDLYDFIPARYSSSGIWSDEVMVQRTSTIDPDADDDMYDYIGGTHCVEQLGSASDALVMADDALPATYDELYDYPPLRPSSDAPVTITSQNMCSTSSYEVDRCPLSATTVVQRQLSSSLSTDSHYDVLPCHLMSPPFVQLSLRKSEVSESSLASLLCSAVAVNSNSDASGHCVAVDSVGHVATANSEVGDDIPGSNCPAGTLTDEHYDILPYRKASNSDYQLSVRKPPDAVSDATEKTTASSDVSLPSVIPSPSTSSSALGSNLSDEPAVITSTDAGASPTTVTSSSLSDQQNFSATSITSEKLSLPNSKLTASML